MYKIFKEGIQWRFKLLGYNLGWNKLRIIKCEEVYKQTKTVPSRVIRLREFASTTWVAIEMKYLLYVNSFPSLNVLFYYSTYATNPIGLD